MKAMLRILAVAAILVSGAAAQKDITDDTIHDQVMLRLAGDPMVNGGALQVEVKNGNVILRGRLRTEKSRAKATAVAKKVKGVKAVDNQIQIDPNAH